MLGTVEQTWAMPAQRLSHKPSLPCTRGRGVGGEGARKPQKSHPLTPTPLPLSTGGEGPTGQTLRGLLHLLPPNSDNTPKPIFPRWPASGAQPRRQWLKLSTRRCDFKDFRQKSCRNRPRRISRW
jgi:hypothetical protein